MRSAHWQVRLVLLLLPFCEMTAQSGTYSDIVMFGVPTANSAPGGITVGPDGALWFTEQTGNKIGRFNGSGPMTEYASPTPASNPSGITAGPDGAVWFCEWAASKIGRIITGGAITEFVLPTPNAEPNGITLGPDGALWFVEEQYNVSKIGRITTEGKVAEYAAAPGSSPFWIISGPDQALWFTEHTGGRIGRITTAGAITEYPILTANSGPDLITTGPDGAMWFTENGGNKIGRITTSGVITEYPLPTPGAAPDGITTGPDGAVWFVEQHGDQIGRITTSGRITEFPGAGSEPLVITVGPNGRDLWFTVDASNSIARAPACALGLSASFASNTLTTKFDLGVSQPGIWVIDAENTDLLRKQIPSVAPPLAFSKEFGSFPHEGEVTVTSSISAGRGHALCSEWTTVSTGQ